MAKNIIKKTPTHCAVKISGAGAETISLATDLLWSNATQHETASTPTVNITAIHWSIPTAGESATIVRNSNTSWDLTIAASLLFNGWTDNVDNTHDIVITIPSGGGTVVVELLKVSGYGNTQQLNSVV